MDEDLNLDGQWNAIQQHKIQLLNYFTQMWNTNKSSKQNKIKITRALWEQNRGYQEGMWYTGGRKK